MDVSSTDNQLLLATIAYPKSFILSLARRGIYVNIGSTPLALLDPFSKPETSVCQVLLTALEVTTVISIAKLSRDTDKLPPDRVSLKRYDLWIQHQVRPSLSVLLTRIDPL